MRASSSKSIWRGSSTRSTNHIDEQSTYFSSSVTEKRSVAARLRAELRVADVRVAPGRRRGPHELRSQPGRGGDGGRPVGVVAQAARERAQALAVGRRLVERVGDVGQPAAAHEPGGVVAEHAHDLGPERRGLERLSLVGRRLAGERQPGPRAGARDREEVPLDLDGVGAVDAERLGGVGVEHLPLGRRARQAPLLEAEHERGLEAARARPAQVEHGHPARLRGRAEPHREPRRRPPSPHRDRPARARAGPARPRARPAPPTRRRAPTAGHESGVERSRGARHRARDLGEAVERVLARRQPVERRVALRARRTRPPPPGSRRGP